MGFIISMVDDKDAEDNAILGNDSGMWRWGKRKGSTMGGDDIGNGASETAQAV